MRNPVGAIQNMDYETLSVVPLLGVATAGNPDRKQLEMRRPRAPRHRRELTDPEWNSGSRYSVPTPVRVPTEET